MTITAAEMLQKVLSRKDHRNGVGLALGYFGMMLPCLDDDRCDVGFGGGIDPQKWSEAIKEASTKFVYADEDMLVTDAKSASISIGTPALVEATEKAILDFHCVVTTDREDRDGDTIHTPGVELDPRAVVLYQHNSLWPIGRVVKELPRSSRSLPAHCALADVPMAHDAAVLIEFKALRISHGFIPTEVEEKANGGFLIKKCKVVEVSPVSVPSNEEAFITAWQRGKLFHPVNKALAANLRAKMPDSVVGGYDPTGKNAPDGHGKSHVCGGACQKSWKASPRSVGEKQVGVQARMGYDGTFWIGVNLEQSWEWVAEELDEAAKEFLNAAGVGTNGDRSYGYPSCCVIGTFSDSAVVALIARDYPDDGADTEFYRCTWEMRDGLPTFTGTPEKVDLKVSVEAADPAEEKSFLESMLWQKRMAGHVVDKLKKAKELLHAVKESADLPAPHKASADAAHAIVHEVAKAGKSAGLNAKRVSAKTIGKLDRARELTASVAGADLKATVKAHAEAAHGMISKAIAACGGKAASPESDAEEAATRLCSSLSEGAEVGVGYLMALKKEIEAAEERALSAELFSLVGQ